MRELAVYALDRWTLPVIEDALGREAMLILPPAVRTRKLTVRLPLYQIGALRVLAEDGHESVDPMLERMFHELMDLPREQLSLVIPGLAEVIAWPEVQEQQQPC